MSSTLLEINDLTVKYTLENSEVIANKNISLSIQEGDKSCLLGFNGSGKTTLLKACIGLLSQDAKIESGKIMFQDKNITQYPDTNFIDYQDSMQCIRGKEISMIFQNPANYFDPTMKIGKQIYETLCAHDKIPLLERKKRAINLLEEFQVPDSSRVLKKYPLEVSIGTLQKIAIALAFVHKPKLILADEPFSSIDELSKQSLIQIFKKYQKEYGITILYSLHDLNEIKALCDYAYFMKDGEIIYQDSVTNLFIQKENEDVVDFISSKQN